MAAEAGAAGTVTGMKLVALAGVALMLAGCAAQPTAGPVSCLEITGVKGSVAGEIVRTSDGMLLLRGTDLVLDDSGAETIIAREVQEVYTVANIDGRSVVVYRGADDGESSPLIAQDVSTGARSVIGVGATFEYIVTQVSHDSARRAWIVTAQSDLSETFSVIGQDGKGGDGDAYAPYEYNSGPYLAAVVPGNPTAYLALEAPEGSVAEWSVARLDRDGRVLDRREWPADLAHPDGVVDTLTGAGMYVHTVDGRDAVALESGGELRIVPVCSPARGRWLSRH